MNDIQSLKQLILQKLIRGNVWGGKHTQRDFIMKGIPEHYRQTHKGQKSIADALKELINSGWIKMLVKRTGKSYDQHVSLNPRKTSEIKQFLEA